MNEQQDNHPVDVRGLPYRKGDQVARAAKYYQMDGLHIQLAKVTRVENNKVYLDDSPRPMKFPERLAILGRRK